MFEDVLTACPALVGGQGPGSQAADHRPFNRPSLGASSMLG
ncbi:hypothetical protein GGR61_001103 [Xanthomonas arboricola]|nr:hypothetical protein [Xanthomonas sp. 3058]